MTKKILYSKLHPISDRMVIYKRKLYYTKEDLKHFPEYVTLIPTSNFVGKKRIVGTIGYYKTKKQALKQKQIKQKSHPYKLVVKKNYLTKKYMIHELEGFGYVEPTRKHKKRM